MLLSRLRFSGCSSHFRSTTLQIRRYASPRSQPVEIPTKSAIPSKSKLPRASVTSANARLKLPVFQARKMQRATDLYAAGQIHIYQAPFSQAVKIFASFTLAAVLFAQSTFLFQSGHWDMSGEPNMGWGQKRLIEAGYTLGGVFSAVMACYAIYRYSNLVKSIDLRHAGGNVKLSIKVRWMLLPWKTKNHYIQPYNLTLPFQWQNSMRIVQGEDYIRKTTSGPGGRGLAETISRGFYVPFRLTRDFFFRRGVLPVEFEADGGEWNCKIDVSGWFSNEGQDLAGIAEEALEA